MSDLRARPGARAALLALVLGLGAAACSGSAGSVAPPTPGGSSPTMTPAAGMVSQASAVAAVLAQDPAFAGLGPRDPDLIGQSAWYEVAPGSGGWQVTITKGSGDCEAGCINRHTWTYHVDASGTVTLLGEGGDPLPSSDGGSGGGSVGGVPASGVPGSPPVVVPAEGGPWIVGRAMAGPVCPVVRNPPDPACADRPVSGAVIAIRDGSGAAVARATTAADGSFRVAVPGGGSWTVEAQPVTGLMGTPAPFVTQVAGDPGAWVAVLVPYDTGIR